MSACLYATATADPYFNETFKMPLPPPEKRKYVHLADYRGYTIATYKDVLDEPVYRVAGIPVFSVYFALDEFGDSITPVDTCFWSPFLAMAMVDQYVALDKHARKQWWKQQGAWPMLHQNYEAQHKLPALLNAMREVAAESSDPDLDIMYGDANEYGEHVAKRIKHALEHIEYVPTPDIYAKSE